MPCRPGRRRIRPAHLQMLSDLKTLLSKISDLRIPNESTTAPRFNVFHYFKLIEVRATAILKDLLDPNGRHGQGSLFLADFLQRIGFKHDDLANGVTVRTEHKTERSRSLDLTIKIGKRMVGLENKIGAKEGRAQISDYIAFLKKKCGEENWFFILLTPDEEWDVKSCSKEDWETYKSQGKVLSLSYSELASWIRSWADNCEAKQVKAFLLDMAIWAESLAGGGIVSDLARLCPIRRHNKGLQRIVPEAAKAIG